MKEDCDDDAAQGAAFHGELLHRQWLEMKGNTGDCDRMGFKAKQQGTEFKPIPPGVYTGVCSILVDIGVQAGGRFKDAYKIILGFELKDAPERDDGKPVTISTTLTNSMDKKANLRKHIENWFGKSFQTEEQAKDFDLTKLLGQPALVNVKNDERNGKVYANIGGIMALPKATPKPAAAAEQLFYTDDMQGEERSKAYGSLPPWMQKKVDEQIRAAQPLGAPAASGTGDALTDDDIPF